VRATSGVDSCDAGNCGALGASICDQEIVQCDARLNPTFGQRFASGPHNSTERSAMTSDRLRQAVTELDAFRKRAEPATPDLFSAIATVVGHAGEVWRAEALRAVQEIATRHAEFTVEDVSPLVGATYDRRALAGILLEAQRAGWCRPISRVGSGRERHGRPVRLWASLIYGGADARTAVRLSPAVRSDTGQDHVTSGGDPDAA